MPPPAQKGPFSFLQSFWTWIAVLIVCAMLLNVLFQDTPKHGSWVRHEDELDPSAEKLARLQDEVRDLATLLKGHLQESDKSVGQSADRSVRENLLIHGTDATVSSAGNAVAAPAAAPASPADTPTFPAAAPAADGPTGDGKLMLIDLGANCGNSYNAFNDKGNGPYQRAYLFEVNPQLIRAYLTRLAAKDEKVRIVPHPAWDKDEDIEFFIDNRDANMSDEELLKKYPCTRLKIHTHNTPADASTSFGADHKYSRAGEKTKVQAVNIVRWFNEQEISHNDVIDMKVDIEGAECKVLNAWMDAGMTCRIRKFMVEWHANNKELEQCVAVTRDRLVKEVAKCGEGTTYQRWR